MHALRQAGCFQNLAVFVLVGVGQRVGGTEETQLPKYGKNVPDGNAGPAGLNSIKCPTADSAGVCELILAHSAAKPGNANAFSKSLDRTADFKR